MGRHGGPGESAPRNRGKREPETAPDSAPRSDTRDDPIGRRLRPEESAVTDPRAGFLGSGWSATSELSDPVWPDGEGKPGRRLRTVLLAVAAVAVVLGGTVVGIQLTGSTTGSTECSPGACVAGASNQPDPDISITDPGEDPSSTDEPTPTGKPAKEADVDASVTPAPVSTPRRLGRTSGAKPSPTPTATRAPRRTRTTEPTADPQPTPDPTGEALISDTQPHKPLETSGADPSAAPNATPTSGASPSAPSAGGAAVTVDFGLVKEKGQTYTAQLVVTTDRRLDDLTVRVPVSGEVTSVTGANWSQNGDTLVIESADALGEDRNLVVTFTADGRATTPQTCQSAQGDCVVV